MSRGRPPWPRLDRRRPTSRIITGIGFELNATLAELDADHGDLVLGPEPVMVVSTDHGADMDSSDHASFSVYLDVTLALFGANRYRHGLGIGWSRTSRRVEAWTARPSLDELLNMLDDDE